MSVIRQIGFSFSVAPAAHVGVFESDFIPLQLQIAVALRCEKQSEYLFNVRIYFELFLSIGKSK